MSPNGIPDWLSDYLVKQDNARIKAVSELFGSLSPRQQALVKDAAVMGYVQGARHGDTPRRPDAEMLFLVLSACLGDPDLFPALSTMDKEDEAAKATKEVERLQAKLRDEREDSRSKRTRDLVNMQNLWLGVQAQCRDIQEAAKGQPGEATAQEITTRILDFVESWRKSTWEKRPVYTSAPVIPANQKHREEV